MRLHHWIKTAALGLSALALSACATGLDTRVTRFQAAQIAPGQSFYVVPREGTAGAGFYRYASMVAAQLEAQGFKPAGTPQLADLLVRVDYGVDEGQTEVVRDPFYGSRYGYGGWGRGWGPYGWTSPWYDPVIGAYYGRPYWSGYSAYPYYYGWDDPFYYGSPSRWAGVGRYGRGFVDSYTVYKSYLDIDIVQRASNAPLFEGHAKARSRTDALDAHVPNLIQAMFTGFPGRNGETVKITIPDKPRG